MGSGEDQDRPGCNCPPPGLPPYMATFADLMALLLCFFVLLLSFAEMDVIKFQRLAASLAGAFGVQREVVAEQMPAGTSFIAQEFSPGRPDPTPLMSVMQHTDRLPDLTLETQCEADYRPAAEDQAALVGELQEVMQATRSDAADLAAALQAQIARGEVEVEARGRQIIIRIRERGSFVSGSAYLAREYIAVLSQVRDVLAAKPGTIQVQGHTDNVPINTADFRSNWALSAARAVSVAHELLKDGLLAPQRVQVNGFADTRPLSTNDDAAGRAANRRVEIVVNQGLSDDLEKRLSILRDSVPGVYRDLEARYRFELRPSEIF